MVSVVTDSIASLNIGVVSLPLFRLLYGAYEWFLGIVITFVFDSYLDILAHANLKFNSI